MSANPVFLRARRGARLQVACSRIRLAMRLKLPVRTASRWAAAAAAAALLASVSACGDDEGRAETASAAAPVEQLPPAIIQPLAYPYAPGSSALSGRMTGIVRLAVVPPEDTIVRPASQQDVCGTQFRDETVRVVQADRLAGALVWVSNPPAGKPMPTSRRFEITAARCRLTPRVVATVAGGTLNVKSSDRVLHRIRVLNSRSGDIHAVLLHNDRGQVIPVHEPLETAGLLELRGDVHQWMRAWVAVFDHPYFTVTGRDGSFELDSLPPGRYELRTWHERFGVRVDSVEVGEGETVVEVSITE